MTEVELAFVHLKDSTKGMRILIMVSIKRIVLLPLSVSLGHALLDATKAIVIAQCGRSLSQQPRRTNMFSSTAVTIVDDAGDQLGVGEDFDKEVYIELIELYSSPADWIHQYPTSNR